MDLANATDINIFTPEYNFKFLGLQMYLVQYCTIHTYYQTKVSILFCIKEVQIYLLLIYDNSTSFCKSIP